MYEYVNSNPTVFRDPSGQQNLEWPADAWKTLTRKTSFNYTVRTKTFCCTKAQSTALANAARDACDTISKAVSVLANDFGAIMKKYQDAGSDMGIFVNAPAAAQMEFVSELIRAEEWCKSNSILFDCKKRCRKSAVPAFTMFLFGQPIGDINICPAFFGTSPRGKFIPSTPTTMAKDVIHELGRWIVGKEETLTDSLEEDVYVWDGIIQTLVRNYPAS